MLLEKTREIAPEEMKKLSNSRKNAKVWMCLVVKVKSRFCKESVKNNIDCIGTWNQGILKVIKQ